MAVILTRSAGETEAGEVFLQAASSKGPDPFSGSTAGDSLAGGARVP
ncbi:hypothetical protein [Streptomyces sp. 8N616]